LREFPVLTVVLCSYPQGEWNPKQIDNPDYKGVWVHPEIDNPEYSADDSIYKFDSISVLGLDLWQVNMLPNALKSIRSMWNSNWYSGT